jgi:hypothetical protein
MYARHLLGRAGEALSVNSYLPMSARLREFGDAVEGIAIDGNYPFDDHVSIKLELSRPVEFPVDFMLPEGADSIAVAIEGQQQTLTGTPTGHHRLLRTWQPGETVEVTFGFPLKAHFHTGRDGGRWVAFTRGPLALAQDAGDAAADPEPAVAIQQEQEDAAGWLEPVAPEAGSQGVAYRVKGTTAVVIPYYLAGSTGGGVRTLFAVE